MRKVYFVFMVALLMGCSMTKEQKVEKLVKDYLNEYAHDPSSVEIISIGELTADSASTIEGTALYTYETERIKELRKSAEDDKDIKELYELDMKEIREAENCIEESRRTFKSFFFWRAEVAYRAKNAIGALVRTTAHVKFDKELTKIEEFKPAEE